MYPSLVDDNGPSRPVWLTLQQIFLLVCEGQPEASVIWWTDRQTHCQGVRTPKQTPLSHPYCPLPNKPTDSLEFNVLIKFPTHVRKKTASVADLFLSVWTDRLPVRTSSYLKGMHWRDLRGEKVTQVTSEAKCLDCVQAPLATWRSSTLPCLSSSQLHWMRPAGTAPLSDNCNSGLCPRVPLASPPSPSRSPGLINHTYNTEPCCRRGAVSSFHDLRSKCALQHSRC